MARRPTKPQPHHRSRSILATALLMLVLLAPCALRAATAPPPPSGWARWDSPAFQHLTVRDGLPHATTTAFAQDSKGLMWIGTFGGLVRYDGYRVQVFRQTGDNSGPPDNYIRVLQTAADGSLIVGTSSGGLARFDPHGNRFDVYDASPAHGTGPRILALAPDVAGGFWIGNQNGLSHLRADLHTIERSPPDAGLPPPGVPVFSVRQDHRGNLWVGSGQGLYLRRAGAARFVRFDTGDTPARRVLAADIWALREDPAGNLWVGSGTRGVAVIGPRGQAHVPAGLDGDAPAIQHRTIRDILATADGRMWIATDGVGIAVYDPASGALNTLRHDNARPGSPGGNIVRALFLDRSDGLWAATEIDASRCDTRPTIVHTLDGLALSGQSEAGFDENVRSVHTGHDGVVWLGFNRGRIAAVDPRSGRIRRLTLGGAQQDQDVRAIATLADGRIVAGARGLVTIDPVSLAVRPWPIADLDTRPILALARWRDALLVGTYNGLYRIDRDGQVTHDLHAPGDPRSLVDNQVRNIAPLPDGSVWIATSGGISILRPGAHGFDNLVHIDGDPESLPQNYTGSIVTAHGRIWIGTYGGLASTPAAPPGPRGYRFEVLRGSDGLGSDNVASVLADRQGRLWIATASGLAVYEPGRGRIRSLGERDGLAARFYNHRTATLGPSGELLFGGLGGLTAIDPAPQARPRQPDAPLAVTEARRDGIPLPYAALPTAQRPLRLDGVHALRLDFALLDYTASADVRYRYRLDGFDAQWTGLDAGVPPAAAFTNLPGGSYRLWLQAAIPGLHARTVQSVIPIEVRGRWYERGWVRLALALCGVALVYLLVRLRTRYLLARANRLARLVQERTRELQEANERLNRLAGIDELTGLLNRRELMHQVELARERALSDGTPLSILMLDLDAFKALNDTHGHQAGDAALQAAAARVAALCTGADRLGRYGGEELMAVLPATDLAAALPRAEAMRLAIETAALEWAGAPLPLTTSIGVAQLEAGERTHELVARADAALYRAKRSGRNRVAAAP
ncbi:diguanylate cyclase [Frateuria sp. STR12]|uniref:diguanylate cyclase n=1 Tax=Frateuria hangzhouensis TaxID=2995589 RepID=UPI002260D1A4|nr:diguanylate cyclase [Frateuria sp. STR12]MCX7514020.1 diguanylate cyclase [Frateuria sp. STR12]